MPFEPNVLRSLLQRQKIATLAELKKAIGTSAAMTVFRKLRALGYQTSYSHRGKYYTLADIPDFDDQGLWFYRAVGFSRDGTLLATAQRFVEEARVGFTAGELRDLLQVEVKEALLHLYRQKRIGREQIGGRYVYLSRGWRHRNLAMAATARSLSSSELMCILWPGDAGSFLESRCSAKGRAKRGAGASPRKKNPASN
jgi:hypothetical protein